MIKYTQGESFNEEHLLSLLDNIDNSKTIQDSKNMKRKGKKNKILLNKNSVECRVNQ